MRLRSPPRDSNERSPQFALEGLNAAFREGFDTLLFFGALVLGFRASFVRRICPLAMIDSFKYVSLGRLEQTEVLCRSIARFRRLDGLRQGAAERLLELPRFAFELVRWSIRVVGHSTRAVHLLRGSLGSSCRSELMPGMGSRQARSTTSAMLAPSVGNRGKADVRLVSSANQPCPKFPCRSATLHRLRMPIGLLNWHSLNPC